MLLAVAVRQADLACAGQVVEGWNEWSHSSWQALQSSSSLWTKWSFSQTDGSLIDTSPPIQHFYGKYASLRSKLDYTYHANYSLERQELQDYIIDSILNATAAPQPAACSTAAPWVVFMAGAMGAGKSWSIQQLSQRGHFPLDSFVTVDYDDIRHELPEFSLLVERHPLVAGKVTSKEAGFVAELLTLISLQQGRNVLVDGSLRNAAWYQWYFRHLRKYSPDVQIAILHVTAPRNTVLQRAQERSKSTGRVVPDDVLEHALHQVPKSIQVLRHQVDYFAEIRNSHSLELLTGSWVDFAETWSLLQQDCPQ